MNLTLTRRYLAETYTIGTLSIDGEYFCDTIEDKVRDLNHDGDLLDEGEGKIFGQTAIPYGTYIIELSISPKFKRVLPMLMNVPSFTGIRIHRGNTAEDSYGCILPGENKIKGKVINSTQYEVELIHRMTEATAKGDNILINVI